MGVLAGLLRNEGIGTRSGDSFLSKWKWSTCSNVIGALLLVLLMAYIVIMNVTGIPTIFHGLHFIQYPVTWCAMEFIISLTFEDESAVSKVLTSRVALYLGRISYSVYLIHFPVQQYISYITNGESAAEPLYITGQHQIGMWTFSIFLGILLNRFIEEPLRKKLRPSHVIKEESTESKERNEGEEERE